LRQKSDSLTPGATFHVNMGTKYISMRIALPFELEIPASEVKVLEDLLKDQASILLRHYFEEEKRKKSWK